MRYKDLPKAKITKKHTPRKKRRATERIMDAIIRKEWPRLQAEMERAMMNQILFGTSYVEITWDPDACEICAQSPDSSDVKAPS